MDEKQEVRLSNGRFGPGNKTGGRKSVIDEEERVKLFRRAFPKKAKLAILEKLCTMAERGDIGAIKLILEYLYGKPVDRKEISGGEKEINIHLIYDENQKGES